MDLTKIVRDHVAEVAATAMVLIAMVVMMLMMMMTTTMLACRFDGTASGCEGCYLLLSHETCAKIKNVCWYRQWRRRHHRRQTSHQHWAKAYSVFARQTWYSSIRWMWHQQQQVTVKRKQFAGNFFHIIQIWFTRLFISVKHNCAGVCMHESYFDYELRFIIPSKI